jgi:PTS system N-acetylglucosamine-specific IIC component
MKQIFLGLQQMGRAFMLPIAVLPVAGLLLRLGQPDVFDVAFIASAGEAIFSSLGLLFAAGIAVGFARENHGAAALASIVGYVVATKGAEVLIGVPPEVLANLAGQARDLAAASYKAHELAKLSVPVGILSGLIAGMLYNRFSNISLPSYLAFFGGRRFVPIASGVAGLGVAAVFGWGWPILEHGMDLLSRSVLGAGDAGLFAYGLLNRVLIVTGLHHILNNIAWFLIGDFNGVTGDLKRFFAGDPQAGLFMSGFFPVMMFGLPAACLAMYHAARPERRKAVAGLFASMALTSFLTGVTEPIEFTFMFLAPVLYGLHAVLTGLAMMLMPMLGVHLGFSFSAGLFDYVLNFSRASRPWMLIPVGLAYAVVYYTAFRFCIRVFDLKTPGREPEDASAGDRAPVTAGSRGSAFVKALGGAGNLVSVDACTTRLRLVVAEPSAVDTDSLKQLGARGIVRPAANAVQVVLGPMADQVAGEIREAARAGAGVDGPQSNEMEPRLATQLLAALGGRDNVKAVEGVAGRALIQIEQSGAIKEAELRSLVPRGIARTSGGGVQLLLGASSTSVSAALQRLLAEPAAGPQRA